MTRGLSFAAMALVLAILGCGESQEADTRGALSTRLTEAQQPHVIFLLVDMLRADWTTPYGDDRGTTPELERWAQRGVLFEEVRSQSSWTKVSMASTMTSRFPAAHGIREATDGLAPGAETLADAFKSAGYSTYGVQTNGWLHPSFGFDQGFDRYSFPIGGKQAHLPRPSLWAHADRVMDEATRIVSAHDPAEPMFLYLHFMDVHEFAAPQEFQTFGQGQEAAYLSAIRWVDDSIARVLELLDDHGIAENAVIVFASDHGEAFGENGLYGHAKNVLSSTTTVPLVFRFPFAVEATRVPNQVRNIDIAPTLLELAGIPVPEAFEGASLVPLMEGATEPDRETRASLRARLFKDATFQELASDGRWVYVRDFEDDGTPRRDRLFDREVDPGEYIDVSASEPDEAERMREILEAGLSRKPSKDVRETNVRIDPGIADRLRAMGYLQ